MDDTCGEQAANGLGAEWQLRAPNTRAARLQPSGCRLLPNSIRATRGGQKTATVSGRPRRGQTQGWLWQPGTMCAGMAARNRVGVGFDGRAQVVRTAGPERRLLTRKACFRRERGTRASGKAWDGCTREVKGTQKWAEVTAGGSNSALTASSPAPSRALRCVR